MQKEKLLVGQLSAEDIEKLKKEHGELNGVIAGAHIAYFRPVTRQDVNIATTQIDRDAAMDFNYYVVKECFVGGSAAVFENDRNYLSAQKHFKDMIEGEKTELVKL
jgi:acyl-CoA thioesterase FadM